MDIEQINCPYCSSSESQLWSTENGYTAVKCFHCGFVYVNPRPTLKSISEATQVGLHQTQTGKVNTVGSFRWYRVNGFQKRLLDLFPDVKGSNIRWLDIGAGFGELLLALEGIVDKKGGARLVGVEPCMTKLKKATQLGLDVTDASLCEIAGPFDFVSLVNVFSHLPDPMQFIAELKNKLAPGGQMLLVTGNGGDIQSDEYPDKYYFPDHLVFAGQKHIIGMLEQVGFEIVQVKRYRRFLPENKIISTVKALITRQPLSYKGPFRSLWVRCRLREC